MQTYRCDGCGVEIQKGNLRYTLSIDIRAAYDKQEIGLTDLVRDHRAELVSLIEKMEDKSSEELEESVYKAFKYDLCPACQRAYIRNPLAFFAQAGSGEAAFDVDTFLRSLGFGERNQDNPTDE